MPTQVEEITCVGLIFFLFFGRLILPPTLEVNMSNRAVFYGVPGPVINEKPLVVRNIGGRSYYWNYQNQKWTRLTKRCPLL